ncbi:DNA replication complex GINS protein PSF3 [Leptopilina heterotoma]|uniref:DNA replication complex GINS protein PSF3 n=1 Tax=Leptopilina heterotoma TaxID=63436 RepID=UPI001CA839F7|nr:DNA replication complex GINS protein PSF3 [Leptopilina heterotoma]
MAVRSYMPNYFSITDILATEERLKCTLQIDLPGLGFLDPSSETQDLKAGSKLELPFWLVRPLNKNILRNSRNPKVVVVEDIPKIYKEAYRDILEAGATAFQLSNWSQYFYEFGMHLRVLDHRDCERITGVLNKTFVERFRLIADLVENSNSSESAIESQLPTMERELYRSGKKASLQLKNWMEKGVGKIETSEVVSNMKKRKRSQFENN